MINIMINNFSVSRFTKMYENIKVSVEGYVVHVYFSC